MCEVIKKTKPVLSFFNLSDTYEIKARFIPGVLTAVLLLPAAFAFKCPLDEWIATLIAGTGICAVIAAGISHLASAMGNRFQGKLWPRWPHDSPTHQRLYPNDTTCSIQQKQIWYKTIKRLTSLDITAAVKKDDLSELEAVINDALTQIRTRLWKSPNADRLQVQNIDYGFARNFTGLRLVWLPFQLLGVTACWVGYHFSRANLEWSIVTTLVAIMAYLVAFFVLPKYVEDKANHYADSFYDAMLTLEKRSSLSHSKALARKPPLQRS